MSLSKNIYQVYQANPSTSSGDDDLFYLGKSPYGSNDDSAIKYSDLQTQIFNYVESNLPLFVESVSGTTNRITSTGGQTPIIDIASTYIGQNSITTLGTITTGTWNGNPIDLTSYVTGNLGVTHLNSGTLASNTTFWRGDGTWAIPSNGITPSALTKVDDTNVTLTLGGTPSTALLQTTSITAGWTGTLSGTRGGTGVNNGTSTITIGGSVTYSGAFTFTGTLTGNTSVTFPTSGTLATTSSLPTGAALTKTDDTNVTLTLGGSPTTALLNAASITAGWTGTLGTSRGGLNSSASPTGGTILRGNNSAWIPTTSTYPDTVPVNNILYAPIANVIGVLSTANNGTLVTSNSGVPSILAGPGTTGNIFQSNASAAPSWSTTTYPSTNAINTLLYASAANVMSALATGNNGSLITSNTGVPSILSPGALKAIGTNAAGTMSGRSVSFNLFQLSAGTYTPTTGLWYVLVWLLGGGGGGGGTPATSSSQYSAGSGGGGGEQAIGVFSAASVGASLTITIGAGGSQVLGGTGGTGGTTSFGSLMTALGGNGGKSTGAVTATTQADPGTGGTGGTGGQFRNVGQSGFNGYASPPGGFNFSGAGASTAYGAGGYQRIFSTAGGVSASGFGSGGGGAVAGPSQGAALAGGLGGTGLCIVLELLFT